MTELNHNDLSYIFDQVRNAVSALEAVPFVLKELKEENMRNTECITEALESIAESLEKLANPVIQTSLDSPAAYHGYPDILIERARAQCAEREEMGSRVDLWYYQVARFPTSYERQ